jgi:para-nitrobenzyl esterase
LRFGLLFSTFSTRKALIVFGGIALSLRPAGFSAADADLTVTINSGAIRGVARASGGAEFLGIPYAQAPVGDMRWKEPVPPKAWSGVRNAAAFGAPCAQPALGDWNRRDAEAGKEDCLFLNVMTPVWPAKSKLPVMVWLHGGGNAGGSASSALYKDGTLVQHGIILVTVNYRLNIFGFFAQRGLSHESLHHVSGNYGLLDQILALRWVQDNIAKFGGDPGSVTLFGQSAGAQDASLLMASPVARGLFRSVIQESGSPLSPPLRTLTQAEETGRKLVGMPPGVKGYPAIRYVRQQTTEQLLKAVANQDVAGLPAVGPIVDGWVIPSSPVEIFAKGQEAAVPVLIGTTTREFGMQGSADDVRKMIQDITGTLSDKAIELYGLSKGAPGAADPAYGSAGDQWFGDLAFRCPISTEAQWHSATHQAVYQYEFNHAIPGQEAQGAVHSSDLPYVFGFYPKSGNIAGIFSETDFKLADLIETYFTNFAKTGDPNGAGLTKWPAFDESQPYLQFTQDGKAVVQTGGLRRKQCDFYREFVNKRMGEVH